MDKRLNKYLSRYGECVASTHYVTREVLRAQGRSLQILHESALAYVSSLSKEERPGATAKLRAKYNTAVHRLKYSKKGFRKTQSFYGKYWGKRLKLTKKEDKTGPIGRKTLIGRMGNHLSNHIILNLEGESNKIYTNIYYPDYYNIEILEDSHFS